MPWLLDSPVRIDRMHGELMVPPHPVGIVVLDGRAQSERTLSAMMGPAPMGVLMLDLLTPDEMLEDLGTQRYRYDVAFLAERLRLALAWLDAQAMTRSLPRFFVGTGVAVAAALTLAATSPNSWTAIVSRGGRPDLAGHHLAAVRTPTLLLVGSQDPIMLNLHREAHRKLGGDKRLSILPGGAHQLEDSPYLERVGKLAADWCARALRRQAAR